jgi:uncharacterized protein (DUF488 family)
MRDDPPRPADVGSAPRSTTVWTVGHSTRAIDEFIGLLAGHGVELIADVRRFPGSRRLPQFGREELEAALSDAGIGYRWLPALGGRRRPDPATTNLGWRLPAFRGYADHMATEEFAGGWFEMSMLYPGLRTAVMCAELLWWRCHRRLISDLLVSLGVEVLHIRDERPAEPHRLLPPARLAAGRLSYPAVDR